MGQCDFCSSEESVWEYPCRSFVDPTGIGLSVDGWAACESCHELIEDGRFEQLAMQSASTHPFVIHGIVSIGDVLDIIDALHKKFKMYRTGPPIRIVDSV